MKRLAKPTVVFAAVVVALAGCAGAAGRPAATGTSGSVRQSPGQELTGTWHGVVTGREMGGGGLGQRATLVVQPDGSWTLIAGANRSEGKINWVTGDVFELEGRFVPDGSRAGARLERFGDGLAGWVVTRFRLTGDGSLTTGIRLERERADSIKASPIQPTATASPFEGGEVLQSP